MLVWSSSVARWWLLLGPRPISLMWAELSQDPWVKVRACRDPFPKTDYRAAIGTLILNLVLEQQIAALSPTSACFVRRKQTNKKPPEKRCHESGWCFFSKRGFNEETQGRFFQCWENVHSLILEAETQSSGYMGDSLLPSQFFLPGSPWHQETRLLSQAYLWNTITGWYKCW